MSILIQLFNLVGSLGSVLEPFLIRTNHSLRLKVSGLCLQKILRKMNYAAVAKWVSDQGITCFHCFSVEHSSSNCQFKDTKCRRIIKIGNKEQKCGKNHHVALHSEIKHGKIVKSVNQQPPAVSNKY